jgi:hypothetical protein
MDGHTEAVIAKYAKMLKHPMLFKPWQDDVFDPKFLELIEKVKGGAELEELLQAQLLSKEVDGVYSFPMLKLDFCSKFLEVSARALFMLERR